MPDIARRSPADLKPLAPGLSPEVLDWAGELRTIWVATGLSMNEFASLHPVDKGTISRYLNGQRVPRDRWFLDKLLAIQADYGQPVTPAVREHLAELQLRALEVAHPHEYRVRRVSDQLEIAITGKLEAERYARALEEQLADRNRQVSQLAAAKGRLRAAWGADRVAMQADCERLIREIGQIAGDLYLAQERAAQAEQRCRLLEGLLDDLDTHAPASGEYDTDVDADTEHLGLEAAAAVSRMENGPGRLQRTGRGRPARPVRNHDDKSPADVSGPTVPRMILGNQLHRFREAAGISPDQAGYEIRASRSKISRMENGQVAFKERDLGGLLDLYGVTDGETRAGLMTLARQANAPGWWSKYGDIMAGWFEAYLGLEAAASVIRAFELQFVHGLFQTEAYARAVTLLGNTSAPSEEIDRRVSLRLKRQDLLTGSRSPQVWVVIDEGALRRPVGGRAVMRAQLHRLIEVAELQHVTVQVVPFSRGGHAAADGSFTVLRFGTDDVPDVVYIEQLTSALYLDKREDVDHYLKTMNNLTTKALTPAQTAQFLAEVIKEI